MKDIIGRHKSFILIFILALILRTYHLSILTTFGLDQGIDFLAVKNIILNRDLPLIGIKVSFAQFFQGPLYLYLLLPFFWLFNLNPLSGPIAAVTISLLTICVLYYTLTKLGDIKSGIIGSLIFAISPQLIKYGNTPLYQHFTLLFLIISIYFLYLSTAAKTKTKSQTKTLFFVVLTGFFVGLSMETHFLATPLCLTAIVYLVWKRKNRLKTIISFLGGLFVGLLPTITFELRYNFLNTRYFIQYISSSAGSMPSLKDKATTWIAGAGNIFGAESNTIGALVIILLITILVKQVKENNPGFVFIRQLIGLQLLVSIVISLLLHDFGWWYVLPFWTLSLILLSLYIADNLKNKIVVTALSLLIIVNLYSSLSQLRNDHGYYMPKGWSMKKIDQVAQVIELDAIGWRDNFNVLSFVDGDTRAYPLRYVLATKGKTPGKVTGYNQNNALYVVYSGNEKEINKIIEAPVWELKEFSPFQLGRKWNIGDNIILYRLDKIID